MSADSPVSFHYVETDADFAAAFPVIVQLRPHLTPSTFAERVRLQFAQGYRLLALQSGGQVRCLAGYRLQDFLWSGRVLYVDDLVTDAASRSRKLGEKMLTRLQEIARAEGCVQLHLISRVHRSEAHRFYFRQGMTISCFHFDLPLST